MESQIEDARAAPADVRTPEERERAVQRSGLELSRRRVLHDLEAAQSPVRRASLESALAFLDEEIRKLGS